MDGWLSLSLCRTLRKPILWRQPLRITFLPPLMWNMLIIVKETSTWKDLFSNKWISNQPTLGPGETLKNPVDREGDQKRNPTLQNRGWTGRLQQITIHWILTVLIHKGLNLHVALSTRCRHDFHEWRIRSSAPLRFANPQPWKPRRKYDGWEETNL